MNRDVWVALRMIRDTIETLGPVGCLASEEYVATNPVNGHILDEAEELVRGIETMVSLNGDKI